MGWERRKRTRKLYYTRTLRTADGRRVRQYFGAGPIAELAACIDLARRIEAELQRRMREKANG